VLIPGRPFQPSVMFAGKAGSETPFKVDSWSIPQTLDRAWTVCQRKNQ